MRAARMSLALFGGTPPPAGPGPAVLGDAREQVPPVPAITPATVPTAPAAPTVPQGDDPRVTPVAALSLPELPRVAPAPRVRSGVLPDATGMRFAELPGAPIPTPRMRARPVRKLIARLPASPAGNGVEMGFVDRAFSGEADALAVGGPYMDAADGPTAHDDPAADGPTAQEDAGRDADAPHPAWNLFAGR